MPVAELERSLQEAQAQIAALAAEAEAARKRSDDVCALLSAAQAAQQSLAAANASLSAERDAAMAADRNAAGQASARVQSLQHEREQLQVAAEALKKVLGW